MTVVAIKSDDALDQAEALTQVLKKAVRDSVGWSLDDTKNHSLEFLALQMKCTEPIDAACEARIAEVIKADRYIWGTIQLSKDNTSVTGTLNFFVRGKGTNKVPLKYSANLTEPTDDSLIKVAKDAIAAVTGGAPKGGLRITAGGVAGQLYVDDQPIGALAAEGSTYQLASGSHRVVVKSSGYADAETTVTVRPATTIDAKLTLVAQTEAAPVDGRMVGGFISLAIGVGTGVVGLWSALEVNSIKNDAQFDEYRKTILTSANACDAAKSDGLSGNSDVASMCNKADTMEIIEAIMFPTAAVAVGVGGFLLGTSSLAGGGEAEPAADKDKKPASATWSLAPSVGMYEQKLQLNVRF